MGKRQKSSFSTGFSTYFQKNRSYFYAKNEKSYLRLGILAIITFIIGFFAGLYLAPVNSSSAHTEISVEKTSGTPVALASRAPVEKRSVTKISTSSAASATGAAPGNASYTTSSGTSVNSASNNAGNSSYAPAANSISIPAIRVNSSLVASVLSGNELSVPASGVSYYRSLYMGHSSGVFANLSTLKTGQKIYIGGTSYTITAVRLNLPVSSDRQWVGNYHMYVLTNLEPGEIVLMTCAGSYRSDIGWSERTLVFAQKD